MGESGTGAAIGELALLQRQHSLLQEELVRLRGTEGRLKDSEKARTQLERQVRNMVASSDVPVSRATPQVVFHCWKCGSKDLLILGKGFPGFSTNPPVPICDNEGFPGNLTSHYSCPQNLLSNLFEMCKILYALQFLSCH